MNLKEKVMLIREQIEMNENENAPDIKETILNSNEVLEEVNNAEESMGAVAKIDDMISETDNAIETIENNANPTEADVIAAEMLINGIKYEVGLTDKKIGLESYNKKILNPKMEMKRLATEFKNVRKDLEMVREGLIGDFITKIKTIVTGFKDKVTPGLKKALAKITGKIKSHDFKLACKEFPEEGLEALKKIFTYETSKIANAHYIFNLKTPAITLENVNKLPKVPVNKSYGDDIGNLLGSAIGLGLAFRKAIDNKDKDAFDQVVNIHIRKMSNHSAIISKHFPGIKLPENWLLKTNIKGENDTAVTSYIANAINASSKYLKPDMIDNAISTIGNIEQIEKQGTYALYLHSGYNSLFGSDAEEKDENFIGLNTICNFDGSLCRLLIGNMFGSVKNGATLLLALDALDDLMELYYKNNK